MTALIDAPEATKQAATQTAKQRAHQWATDYLGKLRERTESRLMELAGGSNGSKAKIGEPTVGQYVAFDVAVTSPIQFTGPPPYQPSKVIAAGEDAFIIAFMFVNPMVGDGFAVPAAVQLGGRQFRMTLDQCNLTTCTALSHQVITDTFSSPADALTFEVFLLDTPDPGPDPALIEANVTVDIVDPAQPYAAFATNFFDVDDDPGFLFVPPVGSGFRNDQPNRYLIYSQ